MILCCAVFVWKKFGGKWQTSTAKRRFWLPETAEKPIEEAKKPISEPCLAIFAVQNRHFRCAKEQLSVCDMASFAAQKSLFRNAIRPLSHCGLAFLATAGSNRKSKVVIFQQLTKIPTKAHKKAPKIAILPTSAYGLANSRFSERQNPTTRRAISALSLCWCPASR